MFFLVVLLCCVEALVSSAPQKTYYNIEDAYSYFEDFVKTYNKEYSSEAEKQARFEVFKNNLKNINKKNKMSQSAVFGVNQFTDLTQDEFTKTYTGCVLPGGETSVVVVLLYITRPVQLRPTSSIGVKRIRLPVSRINFTVDPAGLLVPLDMDVTPLICHLTSTSAIKIQLEIEVHSLTSRSIERFTQIGDTVAFGGIMSEQDYPYQGSVGYCRADASRVTARVTGCRKFHVSSEDELKETLAQVGPISIAVAASLWSNYHGGILDPIMCDQCVNHAVLLVGYGSENGTPYWIIKNSWGTQFGESGYIRISRNHNTCNLMGGQFVTAVVQ